MAQDPARHRAPARLPAVLPVPAPVPRVFRFAFPVPHAWSHSASCSAVPPAGASRPGTNSLPHRLRPPAAGFPAGPGGVGYGPTGQPCTGSPVRTSSQ
ncbi:hypothetical protein GCM10010420_17920 [Streptomyces glaucosporus]|uniref:Secreted protein n=1 Tax=Streptomyces glaucosporus TaxID=284044 RepID=A0ABP5V6V4_9ACTN